jgi:hypothetical protein
VAVSLHSVISFLVPLDVENRDYYAALLKTQQAFVTPTQGKLLNYVQRVPLGVVAQITVCTIRPPSSDPLTDGGVSPSTIPY